MNIINSTIGKSPIQRPKIAQTSAARDLIKGFGYRFSGKHSRIGPPRRPVTSRVPRGF